MKNLLYIVLGLSLVANIYFIYECCFEKECCTNDEKCETNGGSAMLSPCAPWDDSFNANWEEGWNNYNKKLGTPEQTNYAIVCKDQMRNLMNMNITDNAIVIIPCLFPQEPPVKDSFKLLFGLAKYDESNNLTIDHTVKMQSSNFCPDVCPTLNP